MNAIINASEELLIFSVHRNILHRYSPQKGAIMAAFFDNMPLIAGINDVCRDEASQITLRACIQL